MASVVVAVCLAISVLFGQNRVLTSIGCNISLFRSIARETAATNLYNCNSNCIDARALSSFITLMRFALSSICDVTQVARGAYNMALEELRVTVSRTSSLSNILSPLFLYTLRICLVSYL